MQGEDDEVDSGWSGEPSADSPPGPPARLPPGAKTPAGGVVAPRADSSQATPPFGLPLPRPSTSNRTLAHGALGAGKRSRTKTPPGGLEAPQQMGDSLPPATVAAPSGSNNPDRATMPPPMPEEEYIEHVLAMEEGEPPAPRRRMNTLVEHDPLQYDANLDENNRPTKPPVAPPAGDVPPADDFLDLELDLDAGRASSPEASSPEASSPDVVPARPFGLPTIPPPTMRPITIPPLTVRADALDDLPIGEVLESIPPAAYSVRPPPMAGTASPPLKRVAPESSKVRPLPTTLRNPRPPAKTYDSSPSIEVVEDDDGALRRDETPRPFPAVRGRGSARPPAKTPPAGTPFISDDARRTPTPPAPTEAEAGAPPPVTQAPPSAPAVRPAPTSEMPTRALRSPAVPPTPENLVERVAERVEAGDFGRALMLADQAIESGDTSEDLRHYAELCREKLRQTYLERMGSGRTILRVTVDMDTLRSRALDPRLAFLLSLLDGASTVDDVIDMSTMPPLEAVRALHELLQEGVVEIVPTGRRRKAP